MTCRTYQVICRLRSPLHIGWGKVGNLQRTRPYVTGRVLWGALTMRLTRDRAEGRKPATDSNAYQEIGNQVHQSLAFTYFYPAIKAVVGYQVTWPWSNEKRFRHRFLSSHQGTALAYPQQTPATGMLREVEFISPNTLDTGEPVFLMGYVFEKEDNNLAWKSAFKRLQLGGERGYGWGKVELINVSEFKDRNLFDGNAVLEGRNGAPTIYLSASEQRPPRLLAHTLATNLTAAGQIEPFVGREWRSNNTHYRFAGQHVEFGGVYFSPGSTVSQGLSFSVGRFGIWQELDEGE